MTFDIYPAIDLRGGRVVRLRLGDPDQQTVFSDDPAAVGHQWRSAGARWLHVVNLDGAFDEAGRENWDALARLVALGVPVQFGGGLRSLGDVERALGLGVARVVLGTAVLETPDLLTGALAAHGPERVTVGIDTRDGRVRTRGWQTDSGVAPLDLAWQVAAAGVDTIIYTDISRDGVLSGVNAEATAALARDAAVNVIASGGVSSLDDVTRLRATHEPRLAGVIIGRALYEGRVDLAAAIAAAGG